MGWEKNEKDQEDAFHQMAKHIRLEILISFCKSIVLDEYDFNSGAGTTISFYSCISCGSRTGEIPGPPDPKLGSTTTQCSLFLSRRFLEAYVCTLSCLLIK